MRWNQRSLGTMLEKSGSDRAGKHDYPVLSITMKYGLVDQSEKFKKRVASQDTTKYRVAYKNELVVGFPIDEGVLGFQTKYPAGIVSPAYNIWKLKDKANTYIPYLELYIRSPQARRLYASKMQGAVARRRSLTTTDFLKLEIPFPPLDDQKRIAHLLGKVEGLIARRKQHLQQLDDLLKSVFLEMFGDPVRNEKGWELKSVNNFSDSRLGKMRDKKFITGAHLRKYLGNSNVQWFRFVLDELLEMDFDERERKIFKLEYGDLLVCEGGDIGRCAIWKNQIEDCYFQKALHRIKLDRNKATPEYIQYVFLFYSIFNGFRITSKATIAHLTGEKLKATHVPLPPIELQNQFAAIVEKVEGLKSRYQQSLTDLESLYGALSQKAFKGELDLSRVVLLVESTTEDTESTETHRKTKPLSQGFARQLLAAEILHRHNGRSMTQMKLQKLIHLAEYHAQLVEIQGDYQRQAAGPFDNKMMYGIASGLKKQQWFEMRGRGQNATYSPLCKAGYHEKYLSHWQEKKAMIGEVLRLLGRVRPDQCEIVSTLYAAWNDLLIDGAEITDVRIIEQASNAELWHKTKEAIDPDRWPKALQWMRDHDLVPTGYGKHTRKLQ